MDITAKVIYIPTKYSKQAAKRCVESGRRYGVEVETYEGRTEAGPIPWTWDNDPPLYPTNGTSRRACFMSHYDLWRECAESNRPYLILEHDSVFIAPLPDVEWEGACMINDPRGATPRGDWWHYKIKEKGRGVHEKTVVFYDRPDGLAGNSAYLLKPSAAQDLIDKVEEIGAWPNDALMCRQHFDWLEELYPYVTKIGEQNESTTGV